MVDSSQLLKSSELFSKVALLKIRAKDLVEGLLSGHHKSRHKGSSVEFAEYKDYSPGDEIRHIDWKVVGKTDKYHVKQFEESTNIKCTLMLDASGSMDYQPPKKTSGEISKWNYAQVLTASLSYLFLKQFDAAGLVLFNDQAVRHIPPRSKPSHFQNILNELAAMEPSGNTGFGKAVGQVIERLPGRSLAILISDLFLKHDDLEKNLKLMRARGVEVVLFHVLHPDETSLPFEGEIVFESLEDDPPIGLDPYEIRESYREAIQNQIGAYKKTCASLGVDYEFLQTSEPLEQALSYYLLKRNSLNKQ